MNEPCRQSLRWSDLIVEAKARAERWHSRLCEDNDANGNAIKAAYVAGYLAAMQRSGARGHRQILPWRG